jgi:hypothetical protein
MIQETVVTTCNAAGEAHIAPMGVHLQDNGDVVILPFKPSRTLDNLLATGCAVINYCDDVRIIAGCLTGRRDWPLQPTSTVQGRFLSHALAHSEVQVVAHDDDPIRPRLHCRVVNTVNHQPFQGFNRAQYAVIEAAILLSRLHWLPADKIDSELDYLRIGLEKTAGERELQAWQWLMDAIAQQRQQQVSA